MKQINDMTAQYIEKDVESLQKVNNIIYVAQLGYISNGEPNFKEIKMVLDKIENDRSLDRDLIFAPIIINSISSSSNNFITIHGSIRFRFVINKSRDECTEVIEFDLSNKEETKSYKLLRLTKFNKTMPEINEEYVRFLKSVDFFD